MPQTDYLAKAGRYLDVAATLFQILPFGEFRRQQGDLKKINLIFSSNFNSFIIKTMPPTHNLGIKAPYLDVATTSFQILPFDEFWQKEEDL